MRHSRGHLSNQYHILWTKMTDSIRKRSKMNVFYYKLFFKLTLYLSIQCNFSNLQHLLLHKSVLTATKSSRQWIKYKLSPLSWFIFYIFKWYKHIYIQFNRLLAYYRKFIIHITCYCFIACYFLSSYIN